MAIPSPSITITKTDETNKIIYYKVEYGENKRFANTQANYYDYLAGKDSNSPGEPFVGYDYASGNKKEGSASYQTAYDNYESSITISVQYQYYKVYLGETYSGWINYDNVPYDSQSKATEVMESLKYGTLGLYKVAQYSDLKYYIQIKNKPQYSNNNVASFPTTSTVTTTASFTKKPEPDPEPPAELPDFNCSVTAKTNSANAYVSGIKPSDKVSFTINGTTKSINASNGGDASITINGLAEGTKYNWSVSVEGYKETKYGEVTTLTTPKWSISSYTATSVTVQFSGVPSGTLRTVEVYYDEGHANQGQSAGSGSSATTSTITVSGLQSGVKYFVKAKVGDEYIGGIEYFTTPEVLTPSGSIEVDYNNKIVKFNVSNLNVGQSVIAYTRIEPSDGKTLWSQSYERTTSNKPHSRYPFATWTGAEYNQKYAASIYLYNNGVIDGNPLAYVTFKFDSPIIQEPGFRIKSYTLTSVTVFVEGLTQNDTVIATVYDANNTSLGTESESVSSIDGSTKELTISGLNLSPNTQYKVKVSLRAGSAGGAIMTLGEEPFTTPGQTNISYTLTDITTNSVTVNISGALPTEEVSVSFYGVDTVKGTINPNGTVSIVVSNLAVGKKYSGSIRVGDTIINNVVFYTLFEWWLSHPTKGETMGMYNNSPAPVKAEEWNRLVALVNSKLNKNINTVSAGDEMNAGSGGNIKVVASALGVGVASKDEVTASFFNALKTAINNIKG